MSSHTTPRRSAGILLLALVTSLVMFAGGTSYAMTARTDAADRAAGAGSAPKCGKWVQHEYTRERQCLVVTKIQGIVKKDGSYLLHNKHAKSVKATCTFTHATTFTWSASASVKAEAGLLFEKVSAEVTAGVQHSTTDTTALGFQFSIAPHHWAYCSRGHVGFDVAGRTYSEVCGNKGCKNEDPSTFTAKLPSNSFIDSGDGKNIDWASYRPH